MNSDCKSAIVAVTIQKRSIWRGGTQEREIILLFMHSLSRELAMFLPLKFDAFRSVLAGVVTFLYAFLAATSLFGQSDVARNTIAFTYPADEQVLVQFRETTRFPRIKATGKVRRASGGGTEIELNISRMPRIIELGPGYATYVLWAISPEGQADNLGEIKRTGVKEFDSGLKVTTSLEKFALIITAEPHFLVPRPSATVMLENISATTLQGKALETTAVRYFGYSGDYFRDPRTPQIMEVEYAKTPSTILQAKQAIALAKFAGAERDAPTEYVEAASLLVNAETASTITRDEETIDVAARLAIRAAVKAESTALVRRQARERRIERTSSSANASRTEERYSNALEQIDELRAELAREQRNRELSERDAGNYAAQVKELRLELDRVTAEAKFAAEAAAASVKLSGLPSIENGKVHSVGETLSLTREWSDLFRTGYNSYYSLPNRTGLWTPTSPDVVERISRFPTMETKPEVVKLDSFAVLISLTEEKLTHQVRTSVVGDSAVKKPTGELELSLAAKPGQDYWDIDVVLSASDADFSILGNNVVPIRLPKSGDSTAASFTLTAKDFEGSTEKRSKVMATLINKANGIFLAKIERPITILAQARSQTASIAALAKEAAPAPRAASKAVGVPGQMNVAESQTAPIAEQVKALQTQVAELKAKQKEIVGISTAPEYEAPDLSVTIYTDVYPGAKENSEIIISSRHSFISTTSKTFAMSADLSKYIAEQFREFAARSGRADQFVTVSKKTPIETAALMKGFGETLYSDFAPALFKEAFWKLHDQLGDKFRTIKIVTDYPNLPWELMRPRRDGNSPSLDFIGVTHVVGRQHGKKSGPVTNNQVSKATVAGITVIAPAYSYGKELPAVEKEVGFLKTLTVFDEMDGVKRIEGNLEKLQHYLAMAPPHVVHFAGHGTHKLGQTSVPGSSIKLEDGDVSSTVFKGLLTSVYVNRPFFFLNACEVGQSDNFAGFVDGFAPAVLDAGASGYIGALWSIGDNGADQFAELFYKAMADELVKNGRVQMAELLRKTKSEFARNGDPTFLSYIFYGDPNLKLISRPTEKLTF